MSKVYGQKPTNAISAVVRHDELADSVTQESNLKRQQSIGQIGETLPLVFCRREGNVGGTWISPRIIGVGVKEDKMSLLYPLSVGRTGGLDKNQIFVGYDKFSTYPGAYENHAYEKIPSGIDLTYDPGVVSRGQRRFTTQTRLGLCLQQKVQLETLTLHQKHVQAWSLLLRQTSCALTKNMPQLDIKQA